MIKQEELERTFKSYIKSPYVLGLVMMHLIYTTLVTLVVFSFVLFIIFFFFSLVKCTLDGVLGNKGGNMRNI
ncbi:hypothetical protein [Robertmurraya massiliosenegalensis]|uniref:hypothetical protein n=1 Tax=Robertmurraya massiliosenegalensis TaxID=1287657 RepID=UPI00031D85B4|nr:hypothetical protein [Robertmurraya massiliosenegalensis]